MADRRVGRHQGYGGRLIACGIYKKHTTGSLVRPTKRYLFVCWFGMADRPSVGSEESISGSRPFEVAMRSTLLDLVSAPSLPPAILLWFTGRQRHELPGHQVAESAVIRNRAMAQQLCEHAQSLVGEVLVDERFLPG